MRSIRSLATLAALVALVACSATPPGGWLQVGVCAAWADDANPAPDGPFTFTVSVEGNDTAVELAVGACTDLGPYAADADVTIAQSVPSGQVVVAIERQARGPGADQVLVEPETASTTFPLAGYDQIVFASAVRVDASVAITSVVAADTDLPVDPDAVSGTIDVTVTVDPGNAGLRLLEAFVGGTRVHDEAFDPAALGGAPFDVTFAVATDAYTVAGAEATVAFPNGDYDLAVRLGTIPGGAPGSGEDATALTLANVDTVDVAVQAGATALDAGALAWQGQGLTATFAYVGYTGATAAAFQASYVGLARSTNPAVWTAADLAGFTSTASGSDLTVATVVNGDPGPSATTVVRYDGVSPAVGTGAGLASDFVLSGQVLDGTDRCCSDNWVGPAYAFAARAPSASDVVGGVPGVGGVTVTYHAGEAGLTDAQLAALPAAATPAEAGLAASGTNTAYSVVARVADALGNVTLQRLVGSGVNPATTFGVDAAAPQAQALAPGSVADRRIYNANVAGFGPFVPGTIGLTATDAAAGLGIDAAAVRFRSVNAADGTTCLVGATAACTPTQRPLTFTTDNTDAYLGAGAVTEAYYRYEGQVHDQAGNASGTTSVVTYLFDQTRPDVDDVVGVVGTFLPGQTYTFTANASDNVDLQRSTFTFVFPGLTGTNLDAIPLAAPQTLGTPWDVENPTWSAPVAASVPFVTGVEPTDGAGRPSGVVVPVGSARFVVSDVAENQSVQRTAFAPGSFPAPVSFGAGPTPPLPVGATFRQTTPRTDLCFNPDAPCVGPDVRSVTLTATATGPSGTFANPFAFVLFAYVDNFDVGRGEYTHRFVGTDGTADLQDDGTTRTWTWSVTLDAEDLVLNTVGLDYVLPMQAIGISGVTGTALLAVTGTAIWVIDN